MADEALCALGLSFLSSLSSSLFPSTHPAPATLAFLLFPKHSKLLPAPRPLYVLWPLPVCGVPRSPRGLEFNVRE